ncbi:MAG: HEPN domain-containing protein [Candidatus Rokubacteria bacterium]|nr:HEPN domain-containing protein [Candidatus Rokubacteria bacterium]
MTRQEFQRLAELHLRAAMALLQKRHPAGAYYLAGYAVECALKACIAKKTRAHSFPPKHARDMYTHELRRLVALAGPEHRLRQDAPPGSLLDQNWSTVNRWSEEARYERRTSREARDLLAAITDSEHGVLTWLRQSW